MAEYSLIYSGIIILSIAILGLVGGGLSGMYQDAVDELLGVFTEAPETAEELEGACVEWDLIPERRSGRRCSQSEDCDRVRRRWFDNLNAGSFVSNGPVDLLVVKTGRTFHILTPGYPDDGCISAEFSGDSVSWQKADNQDQSCRNVRHVQVWRNPLCP